jgi:hypothetical protein
MELRVRKTTEEMGEAFRSVGLPKFLHISSHYCLQCCHKELSTRIEIFHICAVQLATKGY